MIPSLVPSETSPRPNSTQGVTATPLEPKVAPIKIATIVDEDTDTFCLEYDDTRGQKNMMRLDAFTYEGAIREARSYLGIQEDDRDQDGDLWAVA